MESYRSRPRNVYHGCHGPHGIGNIIGPVREGQKAGAQNQQTAKERLDLFKLKMPSVFPAFRW